MKHAKLENWKMVDNDQIRGEIYNSPKFEDGTVVFTSRVVRLDEGSNRAYTLNTEYELGVPYASS